MEPKNKIGPVLRQLRLESNVSQTEVARRMGKKSRSSVFQIEQETSDCRFSSVLAYLEAIDCTLADLIPHFCPGVEVGVMMMPVQWTEEGEAEPLAPSLIRKVARRHARDLFRALDRLAPLEPVLTDEDISRLREGNGEE